MSIGMRDGIEGEGERGREGERERGREEMGFKTHKDRGEGGRQVQCQQQTKSRSHIFTYAA
jgi:hypothetical protein